MMQSGRRLEWNTGAETGFYELDDLAGFGKCVGRHTAGADLCTLLGERECCDHIGKTFIDGQLKIRRNIRRKRFSRVFDKFARCGFDLELVTYHTRTVFFVEFPDLVDDVENITPGHGADTPDIAAIAGNEITCTLIKLSQLGGRYDKPAQHPVIVAVFVSRVIDHRLRHRNTRRWKEAGVINGPGQQYFYGS